MIPIRLKGFRVINQTEDYTCGLCSMSAVYRYYQFSPEKFSLRKRLGLDNEMLPRCLRTLPPKLNKKWREIDLKGTLPPDMFWVLHEDGFAMDWKIALYESYKVALRRHLKSGHPALALAEGFAHWVVVVGMDDKGLSVADSSGYLDPTGKDRHRYQISHEHAGDCFTGMILVKPCKRARTLARKVFDAGTRHVAGATFGLAGGALRGLRALERWMKE